MNKFKKNGFTLIEILISLLLILITFLLVYRTYFTIQKNMKEVEKEVKNNEILFNFLYSFKSELENIFNIENLKFDKKEVTFTAFIQDIDFPVEITYTVKNNEKEEVLIRTQKNLFSGYTYSFPVLTCESINFLVFQNENWEYFIESDKVAEGIAIEIIYPEKRIFYPVLLNIEKKLENEKK
ncbi:MAG TPA: prepilin-type N-terminal cleavage/methylation domain-containing protein [bacterium]|nr:prepilin-type N-terminal cleavage/methylation domain-containing protein [bacterium]